MTDEQAVLIAAAAYCGGRGWSKDSVQPTARDFLRVLDDLTWKGEKR